MLLLLLLSSHQVDMENFADVSDVYFAIRLSFRLVVEGTGTSETYATLLLCVYGVKAKEQDQHKNLEMFENI
jgi:hypothetical protein